VKDRRTAVLMIAPTVLVVGLIFIYPLILSFWTSLHYQVLSQPHLTRFIGLGNYHWLMREPRFWGALGRSLVFLAFTVTLSMGLGTLIAFLIDRYMGRWNWARALFLMPMVITPVVVGIQWRFLLNDQFGVASWFFEAIRLPIGGTWLSDPVGAMFWVIAVDLWYYTPYVILLAGAGLASIPTEVRDAAKVDGATPWQTIRYVLLPMLKAVLVVALLIRTIGGLRAFDTIMIITDGGPGRATEVANILAYRYGLQYFDMGKASAIGWVMMVVAVVLTVVYIRLISMGRK